MAKIWRPESVTHEAEFVCHEGALPSAGGHCVDSRRLRLAYVAPVGRINYRM
jgi:hypothetical protein